MAAEPGKERGVLLQRKLQAIPLVLAGVLLLFAVIAQPAPSALLAGLWRIQLSEAGLITDPVVTGGVGAALLNAALVLLVCTLLIRAMRLPFTGVTFACLFMMAGFALLGKNLVNIAPIILGGWLYARYRGERFSQYIYMTLFGTCLAPMVSFLLVHLRPVVRWPAMAVCGVVIGFLIPAVARYTVRVHQGYNLYNVGFAAGFLGLGWPASSRAWGWSFRSTRAGAPRVTACCAP